MSACATGSLNFLPISLIIRISYRITIITTMYVYITRIVKYIVLIIMIISLFASNTVLVALFATWFLAASPSSRSSAVQATYEGVVRLPMSLAMICTFCVLLVCVVVCVVVAVGITACIDLCVFDVFQCIKTTNAPRLDEVLVC